MKFRRMSPVSACCLAWMSASVITFRVQPVSWLARRTFWPPRPMAWARLSSATAMSIAWASSSTMIATTSAGAMALITNCAGLSSHRTISTRSPPSSPDTAWTREPRMPMQAPCGSMRLSLERTAILAREPGSREAAITSMSSSAISGTSMRNSSISICGAVRDRISCGPRFSVRISFSRARTRAPTRKVSRGMMSSRASSASALLPRSTITLSRVTFFTVPEMMSPSFSR
ncbi:hypothetical protein D9M68_629020 [compost metagenome]